MWVQNQDEHERMSSQTARAEESPENYYTVLGLSASASVLEIRKAYWEFSKRYHPDTTNLPSDEAKEKFQQIKEAYATLSDPRQRAIYDRQYTKHMIYEHQLRQSRSPNNSHPRRSSNAYLDPVDRPLSAGEISALFFMIVTVLGCVLLAIAIAVLRGDAALDPMGLFPAFPAEEIYRTIGHFLVDGCQGLPIGADIL